MMHACQRLRAFRFSSPPLTYTAPELTGRNSQGLTPASMNTPLCIGMLLLYWVVTLVIGAVARRTGASANSFLNATRTLSLPVVAISFLAANSGALEVIGLSAMAAQYGVQAFHFYWIGAIPAMVFAGLWLMPVYRKSGVRSVPEFLEVRYGPRMRLLNACVLLIMLPALAGIGLYAAALLLQLLTGIHFAVGVCVAATVVLVYVLLGGIQATIFNELFQFAVMLVGLAPLAVCAAVRLAKLPHLDEGTKTHLWTALPLAQPRSSLDLTGVTLGLGFVLSFGYWCTDFVLMQRAFAVRTDDAAQKVPLLAGFGKLLFSMIIVLPGLAAVRIVPGLGTTLRFDQASPALMQRCYGPLMRALGFTAITAGLTSALAANVTAFGALWTEDVYRRYLQSNRTDRHYIAVGRIALLIATLISMAASFLSFHFGDLMEHVQMIFSIFAAPFWGIFLLGITVRRITETAALIGFISGTIAAAIHLYAFTHGHIVYGSTMTANFYAAIYSFSTAVLVSLALSFARKPSQQTTKITLPITWKELRSASPSRMSWTLAAILLTCCALLNYWWR